MRKIGYIFILTNVVLLLLVEKFNAKSHITYLNYLNCSFCLRKYGVCQKVLYG